MTKKKPLVIFLIALYFAIINGLMGSAVSIFVIFLSGEPLAAGLTVLYIIALALCLLSFAVSYGLWLLVDWGRMMAIAICAISVPLNLIAMKIPGQEITCNDAILVVTSIAVDLLIIWYLIRDDVKLLFANK